METKVIFRTLEFWNILKTFASMEKLLTFFEYSNPQMLQFELFVLIFFRKSSEFKVSLDFLSCYSDSVQNLYLFSNQSAFSTHDTFENTEILDSPNVFHIFYTSKTIQSSCFCEYPKLHILKRFIRYGQLHFSVSSW